MKNSNIFNLIITVIILPLWLDFVKDLIKQIPWLYYTVSVILTLLTLLYLALTVHELRVKLDAHFNFQQKRINRLIHGTRKKLQKTIARTSDASVMDYALTKLSEICPQEVYSGILTCIIEKERNPDKQKTLLLYNKLGGHHEN